MNFKKIAIISAIPLILVISLWDLSMIAELLRQSSDMAVMAGVLFACVSILCSYYLLTLIYKQFKQTKK